MNADHAHQVQGEARPARFVAALLSVAAILVLLLWVQHRTPPAVESVYVDTLPVAAFRGPLETRKVPDGGAEIDHEGCKDAAIRRFLQAVHYLDRLYQLQDLGFDRSPRGGIRTVAVSLRGPLGMENACLELLVPAATGPFAGDATDVELWLMSFPFRDLFRADVASDQAVVTVSGLGEKQICGVLTWKRDGRIRTSSVSCVGQS